MHISPDKSTALGKFFICYSNPTLVYGATSQLMGWSAAETLEV